MCSLLKFDVVMRARTRNGGRKSGRSKRKTHNGLRVVSHAVWKRCERHMCIMCLKIKLCSLVFWMHVEQRSERWSCYATLADITVDARKCASFLSLFTHDNRFSLSFCVLCADCCVICMWQNGIFCNPHFIHYMLLLVGLALCFGVIVSSSFSYLSFFFIHLKSSFYSFARAENHASMMLLSFGFDYFCQQFVLNVRYSQFNTFFLANIWCILRAFFELR